MRAGVMRGGRQVSGACGCHERRASGVRCVRVRVQELLPLPSHVAPMAWHGRCGVRRALWSGVPGTQLVPEQGDCARKRA